MKLLTYKDGENYKTAVLTNKGVVDIASIWEQSDRPHSILEILQKGKSCLDKLAKLLTNASEFKSLEQIKLCAPIPRPGKVLALAGNYTEHIKESGLALGLSYYLAVKDDLMSKARKAVKYRVGMGS